eukprot:CAMPEP_0119413992 /NCGR_PEP_ID=MMETSP1335-20130426/6340_1 /TAXON_ID=259385 /ORGANISM="Chrysoculter rhomboideus, Strain RCC1486" /LENGTH=231 /DNA_ID=CAMNT_0007438837 /DNA_START=56 /DNA_END=751 /DNA_ORIENTATION=-
MAPPARNYPVPEITEVRNVVPRQRDERGFTRDDIEKERLKQRTGGFVRYEDPQDVLIQPPDSLGYADDADRFNRDVTGMEKTAREAAFARKELMFYNRRVQRSEREESRWQNAEQEYVDDENALARMRDEGLKWKRNHGSVPYNVLSLQYADNPEGEKLRYEDDMLRYRASLRAANLHREQNRNGIDPINGQLAPLVETLEQPQQSNYNFTPEEPRKIDAFRPGAVSGKNY